MFRLQPETIGDIVNELLRREGLETPLQQRRLLAAWDDLVGPLIAKNTTNRYIKNQTLFVNISRPAIRTEVKYRSSQLVAQLNAATGAFIISNIVVY